VLDQLLPRRFDNTYRGHPLAIWLLVLIVVVKTGTALGAIFDGRNMLQSADGIPVDRFGGGGAEVVIALIAILGLSQLMFSALSVLALTRYRAMIPLLFVLFLLERLVRDSILLVKPIARTGAPLTIYVKGALLAVMIVGLALSLRRRTELPVQR
jgi:hypothetical protein